MMHLIAFLLFIIALPALILLVAACLEVIVWLLLLGIALAALAGACYLMLYTYENVWSVLESIVVFLEYAAVLLVIASPIIAIAVPSYYRDWKAWRLARSKS